MFRKKLLLLACYFFVLFGCKEETIVTFSESSFQSSVNEMVTITVPKAEGNSSVESNINSEIENVIIMSLNGTETYKKGISVDESIQNFEQSYYAFKNDFPDSNQIWEVQIDGDIMFQSENIISIAISSYKNTGGAHGNLTITILNFNGQTGKRMANIELFKNNDAFSAIAKTHFNKAIEDPNVLFDSSTFKLPENIGYTEEGLLLLYNTYEIAPYASGTIDFIIPFEEIQSQLVFNRF